MEGIMELEEEEEEERWRGAKDAEETGVQYGRAGLPYHTIQNTVPYQVI